MTAFRELFLLDPAVTFLNHGSFGACPRPVFEIYQRWQLELERQPVAFLGRDADALLDEARSALADYVGASSDELIFVPNATIGLNTVIRSLRLGPGDEILTTNHEYGALDYTWDFVCARTGARCVRQPIPLPVSTPEALIEAFWQGVTPRTRVIFLSHITSPTALVFPVAGICARARQEGILTIVDGAHVPGHLLLDLAAIGADAYSGNAHKWLCAPKGAAFLHVRREHHAWIEPLVISWGWLPGASFVQQNQWQGTRDLAAFLSIPAAIAFQRDHDWPTVRTRCHDLARAARALLAEWSGLAPIQPDSPDWFGQMVTVPLPPGDVSNVKTRLYEDFRVEVPVLEWHGQPFIRVSFQAYNDAADLTRLLAALQAVYSS